MAFLEAELNKFPYTTTATVTSQLDDFVVDEVQLSLVPFFVDELLAGTVNSDENDLWYEQSSVLDVRLLDDLERFQRKRFFR